MDRSLLLISCVILSIEHSLGKSVSVDLNLAPEWKAEITKRASDYGNTKFYFALLSGLETTKKDGIFIRSF